MRTDNNNNNKSILVILVVIGCFDYFEVFGDIFVILEILRGFGHLGGSKGISVIFLSFNCFFIIL